MEFLITGLRSSKDRKSKNIKLSTLLDPFSLAQEANVALPSLLYCGNNPSGCAYSTAETREHSGEWIEFPVVHFLSDEFQRGAGQPDDVIGSQKKT